MVVVTAYLAAGLAILVGLLVLVWPKILRFAIGFYLILWGILQAVQLI